MNVMILKSERLVADVLRSAAQSVFGNTSYLAVSRVDEAERILSRSAVDVLISGITTSDGDTLDLPWKHCRSRTRIPTVFVVTQRHELHVIATLRQLAINGGEVTAGPTKYGTLANPGANLTDRQHEYDYDWIGNRKWAGITGNPLDRRNYVSNALNQYSSRDNFTPPFSGTQSFSYDDDGNITSDGQWSYVWDAENRLSAVHTPVTPGIASPTARRFEYKYDYLHRRVQKLERLGWDGALWGAVVANSQKRFLYDGWNLVAEYSVSGSTLTLVRSYTWGLDIARTLTDAGGVGALLQLHDHALSKSHLPAYDGNGNVVALFDGDAGLSGTCVAAYEYSPFGEVLHSAGTYAGSNPIRFSTKYTDDETTLVYYGRRYYSPSQGRFLGRDPKAEKGGLNLYGFCRNNSINLWDVLGMEPPDYSPSGDGQVARTVEIRDGVIYNQTWVSVSTGQDSGDADTDFEWSFVAEWRGGTVNVDVGQNASVGMPETGTNFQLPTIGLGLVVATAAPAAAAPSINRTHTITFAVGFDSSISNPGSFHDIINQNINAFQSLLDANGLGYIRVNVIYTSVTPTAPSSGRYGFTYDPATMTYRSPAANNALGAINAGVNGATVIPVLVTNNTLWARDAATRVVFQAGGIALGTTPGTYVAGAGFVVNVNTLSGHRFLTFAHETGHVGGYLTRTGDIHTGVQFRVMNGSGLIAPIVDDPFVAAIRCIAIPNPPTT